MVVPDAGGFGTVFTNFALAGDDITAKAKAATATIAAILSVCFMVFSERVVV